MPKILLSLPASEHAFLEKAAKNTGTTTHALAERLLTDVVRRSAETLKKATTVPKGESQ